MGKQQGARITYGTDDVGSDSGTMKPEGTNLLHYESKGRAIFTQRRGLNLTTLLSLNK